MHIPSALVRVYDGPGAFGESTPAQIVSIKAGVEERLHDAGMVVMWTTDPSASAKNTDDQRKLITCILGEEIAAAQASSG